LWRFSLRFDLDGSVRSENQKGHDLEMLGIVQIVSLVAEGTMVFILCGLVRFFLAKFILCFYIVLIYILCRLQVHE
jgi:hypothetical protein